MNYIQGIKGNQRGLAGGWQGGSRGFSEVYPSEGPRKALGTPYEV